MFKSLSALLLLLIAFNLCAQTNQSPTQSEENSEQTPRFAIHLLDYLAHDYPGAVEHGKIISESEYSEQKEFALKIYEISLNVPLIKNEQNISQKITKLKTMISNKAEGVEVGLMARDIQKDLIVLTKTKLAPNHWPSLTNGKMLFEQNCMSCHGINGNGDGENGKNLDPKPANFHKAERMETISAFHSYNTIRLGVPGTGMPAWDKFSDKEVWDLAFYLMSLRHIETANAITKNNQIDIENFSLLDVSTLSDIELKEKLSEKDDKYKQMAVALLRIKNDNSSSGKFIGIAKSLLNQSLNAYKNHSKDNAKRLALQSYLDGIEPIEPMIKANNPKLVSTIETQMGKIRQFISSNQEINEASIKELSAQIDLTLSLFSEVEESLEAKELSPSVAFSGSFAIILREGFEAVLIILTLLSVIKAFGSKRAALWVHAGWSSALFLGFVTWFLSGTLMKLSGASRELLEAITSSFAVFVLLYFGFWLHRQTEISRWKKFIHEKVQGAIENKNLYGLFTIAFISVFREAFETVLFIRALWFQTNIDGKNAIGGGLLSALALIFSFSFIALKYSKKLPIRELFKISSIMTSVLAFILAGKAVHSLQEAGILNVTIFPLNLQFDTIGFFPTWQTISAQVLTLVLALVLINLNSSKA